MVTQNSVNKGSINGLLPDGAKPSPEPILTSPKNVLWHSPDINFISRAQGINQQIELKNNAFKITAWSGSDQCVNELRAVRLKYLSTKSKIGWCNSIRCVSYGVTALV